jgi:7-cyano-7-deazaguanine tRNA-ribosyltransferase
LKRIKKYEDYLERNSPVTKRSGLFFFSSAGLTRPEIVRHKKRILANYSPPKEAKILVLLPQTTTKPFHKSEEQRRLRKTIEQEIAVKVSRIHICTYAAPFGVVPAEIDEVYPLSQYEATVPFDAETIDYVTEQIENYIVKTNYDRVILLENSEVWKGKIAAACKKACRKRGLSLTMLKTRRLWSKNALNKILKAIQEAVI